MLSQVKAGFEDIQSKLQGIASLNNFVQASNSGQMDIDPDEYFNACKMVRDMGFTLGSSYTEYELTMRGRQAMMRGTPHELCSVCFMDGERQSCIFTRLKAFGHDDTVLSRIAGNVIVDSALQVLGKIPIHEVCGKIPSKDSKDVLLTLLKCLQECKASGHGFLVPDNVVSDAKILQVLDPKRISAACLNQVLTEFDALKEGDADAMPTLHRFFADSHVGMKAVGLARSVLEAREGEIALEEALAKVKGMASAICSTNMFIAEENLIQSVSEDVELFAKECFKLSNPLKEKKKKHAPCPALIRIAKIQQKVSEHMASSHGSMFAEMMDIFCDKYNQSFFLVTCFCDV